MSSTAPPLHNASTNFHRRRKSVVVAAAVDDYFDGDFDDTLVVDR